MGLGCAGPMSNAARFIPFFLVVALLVVATHVYLYRRLVRDTGADLRWRRVGATLLGVLALSGILSRLLSFALPDQLAHRVGGVGFFWVGIALYLVLALGLVDGLKALGRMRRKDELAPVVGPPSPERRVFLARAVGAGALAVAGGAGGLGVFRAYRPPRITDQAVRLPHLPKELDGVTIVQLSDIHTGHSVQDAWMKELVERSAALKPDLFVITGDLADASVAQIGGIAARLGQVPARFGRFFVTGNHDCYSGAKEWCAALPKMGVEVLRNRWVTIGGSGQPSFDLAGVEDSGARLSRDGAEYDLDAALAGRQADRATVLLNHRPNDFDRAVELGVGLQLSGHTHGGQTFPFTAVAQAIWRRCAGLYEKGDARLFVSRGVGFVGPPMRLGSPPEIVRITLLS